MKRTLPMLVTLLFLQPVLAQERRTAPAPKMDVESYDVRVELEPENSFIRGEADVAFKVLEDTAALPFELNNRLTILETVGADQTRYTSSFDDFDSARLNLRGEGLFKAGTALTFRFRFEGTLQRQEFAFLDTPETETAVIHPDGALLLTEGQWFPMHNFPVDAATVSVRVTVPLGYTAVGPGRLEPIETAGITEIFTWKSDEPITGAPVLVARYFRQKFEDGPLPLTFFVTEEFKKDLNPLAAEIGKMVAFYRQEYGETPISEFNVAQVGNVMLPSTGCSGLLLMELPRLQAGELPLMELARRVAQQWWGYSLRPQGAQDAWFRDGFATYAALRYIETNHKDQFETELARQAVQALKYQEQAPIVRGLTLGAGTPAYDSIVGSKGAWVLYMLRQLIGPDALSGLMKGWYEKNAGQEARLSEFVELVQQKTGEDYKWFFVQWLEGVGVPEFRLEYTVLRLRAGGYKIRGQVKHNLELFRMPMDITIETKGEAEKKELKIDGKATSFTFMTEAQPIRLNVDPDGKILRDSERMRVAVHLALGEEYHQHGEFVSAVREYEKARELDPRSSLAHYRLGEAYFEQHSYNNAANSFRDSLNGDLKPPWVETWTHIHLGKIYDILGQRQRALAEYQKAVNSKIDYRGAQAEAQKYIKEPYTKPSSVL